MDYGQNTAGYSAPVAASTRLAQKATDLSNGLSVLLDRLEILHGRMIITPPRQVMTSSQNTNPNVPEPIVPLSLSLDRSIDALAAALQKLDEIHQAL